MITAQEVLKRNEGKYAPLAMPLEYYADDKGLPRDMRKMAKDAERICQKKLADWKNRQKNPPS